MDSEHILGYDGLLLNLRARECLLDGKPVNLTPTQYEIVKVLLESKGRLVISEDLFRQVWKTTRYSTSEKNTLAAHIKSLRQRLGDDYNNPRFISTIHGKGYRLGALSADVANQHLEESL